VREEEEQEGSGGMGEERRKVVAESDGRGTVQRTEGGESREEHGRGG